MSPESTYLNHKIHLNREMLKQIEQSSTPPVKKMSNQLASSTYQVIQNPIENLLGW